MRKEKGIHAPFAVTPQTAEVRATKCLVKMEEAFNLHSKMFWERLHSHNFYCSILLCNCILLVVIVVNLSLCLICKLNFITGMGLLW